MTCTECGKHEARHTVYQAGQVRRLCCFCNYAESGVASDWHPDCMRAAFTAKNQSPTSQDRAAVPPVA